MAAYEPKYIVNFRCIGTHTVPQSRQAVLVTEVTTRDSVRYLLSLSGQDLRGWEPRIGAHDGPVLGCDESVWEATQQGTLAIYWCRDSYP